MPIYTYKCSKCESVLDDIRYSDERDLEYKHNSIESSCEGVLNRIINSDGTTIVMADAKPELVQYWRKNPNAPNGMEVFPHKNKYVKGGY
jgi:hypothetical protein